MVLPSPDYNRPDFVPSVAALKKLTFKDIGSLHLFAIKHTKNSTLRSTFVFQTKLDAKEQRLAETNPELKKDVVNFESPPAGSYYMNPNTITQLGGVKIHASATQEAKERNENPVRRMRFGVGHNGHGIHYLVQIQCFDEFNASLANIQMDGFRVNMGY